MARGFGRLKAWQGQAPGLPEGVSELWMAFGYRAAELSCGRSVRPMPGETEATSGRIPKQRCSLPSTLRFLQAMASVQAGPHSAALVLVNRVPLGPQLKIT